LSRIQIFLRQTERKEAQSQAKGRGKKTNDRQHSVDEVIKREITGHKSARVAEIKKNEAARSAETRSV
jgi:hypothetical protein